MKITKYLGTHPADYNDWSVARLKQRVQALKREKKAKRKHSGKLRLKGLPKFEGKRVSL
jgi:hypothetical protein